MKHASTDAPAPSMPVILVGPHRSGTTWLLKGFRQSPELACFEEPRAIWVYGNWFTPDDVLTDRHARPGVVRHIRRRFARLAEKEGKQRFCDKTPSNALRIPFIRKVFPDAKFVMILRDGRSVFRSTRAIHQAAPGGLFRTFRKRLASTQLVELPAYLSRLSVATARLLGKAPPLWGAKPPGWRQWTKDVDGLRRIALQWAGIVARAMEDLHSLPEQTYRVIHYEQLVRAPDDVMGPLLDFLELDDPEPVGAFFRDTARPGRADAWREEVSHEEIEAIRPIMEPTMRELGYTW